MNSQEAKEFVAAKLELRNAERIRRDAALEDQARQLRQTISGNHAQKTMTEIQKKAMEEENARKRRAERAKVKAEMVVKDMKAQDTANKYGIFCIVMILLAAVSRLNIFVLLATLLGVSVFPVIRICKIYGLV
jgi:hypothetical protein